MRSLYWQIWQQNTQRKFLAPDGARLPGFPALETQHQALPQVKSFSKDEVSMSVYLTAFLGRKAGLKHVAQEVPQPGSKVNKKEVVEAVTVMEPLPRVVVDIAGYVETPYSQHTFQIIFAEHITRGTFTRTGLKSKKSPSTARSDRMTGGRSGWKRTAVA